MGWFFIGAGTVALGGAVFEFNWFMNNRKAQALVRWFGRTGARVFYGLLGTALISLGALIALEIIA